MIPRAVDTEILRAADPSPADPGRQRVLLADALTLPFERFPSGWKLIGNLPYNVASPLLWELFSRMPAPARAVFMLQKEVGLRLTAAPGSRAYGALSVWLQSFTRPRAAFVVPPHVFHPPPKVDSMVLVFEPPIPCPAGDGTMQRRDEALVELAPSSTGDGDRERPRAVAGPARAPAHLPCSPAELAGVLHACFRMRRKQLGSIAAAHGIAPHRLAALGIDPRLRPENLTPEEFQHIAAARLFV
jgi:16S rRNA (adenine1518-N6/adenine1519-N6)-dimethyltransferase